MKFDDFKTVQKTYKQLARGKYNRVLEDKSYKLLPQEFKVDPADKNEKIVAIKMWFETVFLEAIEKILPNGTGEQTSTEKSE